MAGLCAPLSTLRRHPRGYRRMTRGQCGSLDLHCERLALSTPCRSSRRAKILDTCHVPTAGIVDALTDPLFSPEEFDGGVRGYGGYIELATSGHSSDARAGSSAKRYPSSSLAG